MGFIDVIKAKAKADKKVIVLPETEDKRTYEAAEAVLREGTADLILVGSKEEIEKNGAGFDLTGAVIVDPATDERTAGYIAKLVELRQKKGMTEEQAKEILLTNYLYYGVMMVKMGDADGMVSGACLHSRYIKTMLTDFKDKPGTKLVSAFFVMVVPGCRWEKMEHLSSEILVWSRIRIRRNLQQSQFLLQNLSVHWSEQNRKWQCFHTLQRAAQSMQMSIKL